MNTNKLINKLEELGLSENEISNIENQINLLLNYQDKLNEYETEKEELSDQLGNADIKETAELEQKLEELYSRFIQTPEFQIMKFYEKESCNLRLDLSNLSLIDKNDEYISGMFILYNLECWDLSSSPKTAHFVYLGDDAVTFTLEASKSNPKEINGQFLSNCIFINSFAINDLSRYLQSLIMNARSSLDYVSINYCYEKLGFLNENFDKFYASHVINDKSNKNSYLVGNLSNFVKAKGNMEDYLSMLKNEVVTPRLQLGLVLGAMSPINVLLHNLNSDINNIVVNLCGMSSKGKTTMQKLATSVFAKPEICPNGLFLSSNITITAMLRSFVSCNGMLFCIDDLTRFTKCNNMDLEALIYGLESGQSKTICGSWGKVQDPVEFHGTVLCSSEKFLSESSFKEGAQVRIAEFNLDYWTSSHTNAENITKCISQNYGLIGPEFMDYILKNYSNDDIYQKYELINNDLYESIVSEDQFKARMVNKLSVILVTAHYLSDYFEKNTDYRIDYAGIKSLLVELFNKEMARRNNAEVIVQDIVSFYNKKLDKFNESNENFNLYGKILNTKGYKYIALTELGLNKFGEEKYNLDHRKIESLFSKGYLLSELDHTKSNSSYKKRVHFGSKMYRCLTVKVSTELGA